MIKKLFFVALLAFFLIGCKTKNAFNYSQGIVKKETALIPIIEKADDDIANWIEKENNDSVIKISSKVTALIQKTIDEIKKEPAPEATGGEAFKNASIRYFEYMKSIYVSYTNFGKAITEDDRQASVSAMKMIVDNKQAAIDDMQNSQLQFAKANGFRIEGDTKSK